MTTPQPDGYRSHREGRPLHDRGVGLSSDQLLADAAESYRRHQEWLASKADSEPEFPLW